MSESFSALLDESLNTLDMQPGSIVPGVVLDVDKDWVTVHVGLKSEGMISIDEFRDNKGEAIIEVGDEVEVALEAVEDGYGETRISREKARKLSTWKMLEEALETGEFVTGKIQNRVKGGFAVYVGPFLSEDDIVNNMESIQLLSESSKGEISRWKL